MIDYSPTLDIINSSALKPWAENLSTSIKKGFDPARWGEISKWEEALRNLPKIEADIIELDSDAITIGTIRGIDDEAKAMLESSLRQLHPWRKGPFDLFGVQIDAEWRSNLKWNRLKDEIAPLTGRKVLDVGCGNGYYCWRMAGSGATLVVGIDPTAVYVYQFQALQQYINMAHVNVFPLGVDDMPAGLSHFDTVFSMGMLYHRSVPAEHLFQLSSFLREGGELVLETLVIDGKAGDCLIPSGRYAKMANVCFIPSVATLENWLKAAGFSDIRCIDVSKTAILEQRTTSWMSFQSLPDFLDPVNHELTVEGYPSPKRAIFIAKRPF